MEANVFVAKLKADSPDKYNCDLRKVLEEYKLILTKIPSKDRGLFSLNVLRTLCWNLEKAPKWRDAIENTSFLSLAIECVRETRILDKEDRVKTLACIYHIHRHAVRLNKPVPPELVLKISFMPFELDTNRLLKEYHKTYWNILTDRLTYIERLKTRANILRVLPKLTEDIAKVVQIYNTTEFCTTILTFLVKKLHLIYTEKYAKDLSETYKVIFTTLAEKEDANLFKESTEKEMFDIYMKFNDCIYIIADNSSKLQFTDDVLNGIVHTCISFVGHSSELFHCLQTFYLNFFCSVISEKTNITYVETIFNSLENCLETAEKLGYKKAMNATYPYINQLLRLFIEWQVTNTKSNKFTLKIQESCLKLILLLTKKLKDCNQILKCENCSAKSGLHDALRLSFLIKHFITICLSQKLLITNLIGTLNLIIKEQYNILQELERLKCSNYQKYYRKLQTDIHNSAISLNKAQYFEFSINLFEIYLKNELQCPETDHKNITRALFNKSICELDSKLFENALVDAFLSLVFSQEEGLKTDKHMSLVMDIKAKELKSRAEDDDDEEVNLLQLTSVLDACRMAVERKLYGDLTWFIAKVKFSSVLEHEFTEYGKLWPSIAPVGGVWRALSTLATAEEVWIQGERESTIQEILYSIVLETPSVVRTVHSAYFTTTIGELLDELQKRPSLTPDEKLVLAALLFLQCEYDLAAASQKYSWKQDPGANLDNAVSNRTLIHEHAACTAAVQALGVLQQLMPHIHTVSRRRLASALQVLQIFVPQLLQLARDAPALQLAYCSMQIADIVDDHEAYLRNAGFLVTSLPPGHVGGDVIARATRKMADCKMAAAAETKLLFLCDVALYYAAQGSVGAASRLVRAVQAMIFHALDTQPELNLELPVGRLIEAQNALCPSGMTAVNSAQRHYLTVSVTGTRWASRRLRQLTLRLYTSLSTLEAVHLPASLGLVGRARAGGMPALPTAGAAVQAEIHAATLSLGNFDEAQIKIDTHLKRILGLQPNPEAPDVAPAPKQTQFTPKQEVETMRDVKMYRKNQTSPSLPWISVPPANIPDFMKHNAQCVCYGCQIPALSILTCKTISLEAQTYARANENEIARNYFQGFLNVVKLAEKKLKHIEGSYRKLYDDFVVEAAMGQCKSNFKSMYAGSLIELAFFELKLNNFAAADGCIVEIHEVIQEIGKIDPYLNNEVLNLMAASAKLKETTKMTDTDINEFENLSLTPNKVERTPEKRPSKPPKQTNTNIKVKDEEIPKKRSLPKQIKIDNDDDENDFEKPAKNTRKAKKDAFKVPNPIIPKPVLEEATPRPLKPRLLLTQPSDEVQTPNNKVPNVDFFTPATETPEQFFTPMTSIKTYTKSLRHNIVKNLQKEFSTPGSGSKENRKIKDVATVKGDENTKEDSSRKEKVKSNFVIKEDDISQLCSNLNDKLSLKGSATKEVKSRKEMSSAVKEDRSKMRELNSSTKRENTKTETKDSTSKENKATRSRLTVKQDSTKDVPKERAKRSTKEDSVKDKNVASGSRSKKENLVRAVSPGKLLDKSDRESNSRPKRGRQLNLE